MIHPQQDEIRRLVENWAAWTGDAKGAVYSVSPIAWTDADYARREVRRARTDVIKPIGAEAQLTGETLAAMEARESKALQLYCTTSLTAAMAARSLHCGRVSYFRLVACAHDTFWRGYQARLKRAALFREEMAHAGGR